MNYIGKFISNFRDFYNEINAATLTGAIDVVVVEQPDGTFTCSPFHVRFGKMGVLRSREKIVDIEINGEPLDIHMKLGESGEAFFVEEVLAGEEGEDEEIPPHLACSPIPSYNHFAEWSKEPSQEWDDSAPAMTAKMFKAETINSDSSAGIEAARKLSVAGGEFKTIEQRQEDECGGKLEDTEDGNRSSNSSNSANQLATSGSGTQVTGGGGKRKRKKKKKNANNNNNNREVATASAVVVTTTDKMETSSSSGGGAGGAAAPDEDKDTIDELSRLQLTGGEATDFHFFSDTEVTPGCSPDSRPGSPIASDTELEQQRHEEKMSDVSSSALISPPSWKWGELPSPVVRTQPMQSMGNDPHQSNAGPGTNANEQINHLSTTAATPNNNGSSSNEAESVNKSMLSGVFSFMKKNKHMRPSTGPATAEDGIYLCDLNSEELDPEVAQLYFPHSYRGHLLLSHSGGSDDVVVRSRRDGDAEEEDAESGNGPSIEHSPVSQSPHSLDEFQNNNNNTWNLLTLKNLDVSISLCGNLDTGLTEDLFNQFIISYDDLVANPMMIDNSNLVVRLNGKYYNWRLACPLVMSVALYNKALPQPVVDMLSTELMPQTPRADNGLATPTPKSPANDTKSEASRGASYSSWFYWRRSSDTKIKQQTSSAPDVQQRMEHVAEQTADDTQTKLDNCENSDNVDTVASVRTNGEVNKSSGQSAGDEVAEEGYVGSNSSEDSDNGDVNKNKLPLEKRFYTSSDKFRKTLRLNSEQIASLNLQEGANEVVFSVTTAYQGTSRCKCHIYKWRYDDRIVISDIDGTITKSDVLGHILPIVGKDWAQSGVAQLFTKIKNNGYKLLYLSARAIGQAKVTREYLRSIKQGDLSLPDGPLLLNPTSLISAFHREVIEKKPEEFKISCLRDIVALFPPDIKPFYAGYGNRVNDVWAYRAVGIPIVRIFTINYKGELKHELTQTFQSSYCNMSHLVDEMFPPPPKDLPVDFSNFVFWRDPIPDIDLTELAK